MLNYYNDIFKYKDLDADPSQKFDILSILNDSDFSAKVGGVHSGAFSYRGSGLTRDFKTETLVVYYEGFQAIPKDCKGEEFTNFVIKVLYSYRVTDINWLLSRDKRLQRVLLWLSKNYANWQEVFKSLAHKYIEAEIRYLQRNDLHNKQTKERYMESFNRYELLKNMLITQQPIENLKSNKFWDIFKIF